LREVIVMMMRLMMSLMKMVPPRLAAKMNAPMIGRERLARGKSHPTIRMNLENLLLCSCSTCPSFPMARGEALYCASGKSGRSIEENGCNCVSCVLYDRCSSFNVAYFCIHGHCGARDERPVAQRLRDLAGSYLERFTSKSGRDSSGAGKPPARQEPEPGDVAVTLHFEREKDVRTTSTVPILQASLGAGIPHTHVCGGRARCSTCRVLVSEGLEHCAPRNEKEEGLARIKGFSPEIRLACQTTVAGDVSLRRLVLDDADIQVAIREGRTDVGDVGHEAVVSILFCDIRSFTGFSERALPYDVIHILNRYFETIGDAIDRNGGYIDKYMGDGIMAIFGLDRDLHDEPACLAVRAARDMVLSLDDFNRYLKSRYNHEFRIGIGIHTGTAIVGSLGFHKKMEYTALGDTVNTASRIEGITKKAGTPVLVSGATHDLAGGEFTWGKKYTATVKGKQEPVTIHELVIGVPSENER
jgi:class 3 adenylate cyclase